MTEWSGIFLILLGLILQRMNELVYKLAIKKPNIIDLILPYVLMVVGMVRSLSDFVKEAHEIVR